MGAAPRKLAADGWPSNMETLGKATRESSSAGRRVGRRLNVRWIMAALGSFLVAAAATWAGPSIAELLSKVRADQASYKGVREVHFLGPRGVFVVRQRVYHAPGGRERFEVLSPPSMAGRLHISDGKRQWRYDPQQREATETPIPPHLRHRCGAQAPHKSPRCPREWDEPAHWRQRGTARVAGRMCYGLDFLWPGGKPTLTLWVDGQYFAVLGLERRARDGRVIEAWKFQSVEFVRELDPNLFTFTPPPGTRVIRHRAPAEPIALADVEQRLRMKPVIPSWLPPGYRLVEERVAVIRRRECEVLWLPFSNGTETFSLFQSFRLPPYKRGPRGAVRWDFGPYTLVVVGKLTPQELEAMRKSLREWPGR